MRARPLIRKSAYHGLKVLKGDKSKVNIQGSEKPVVTKQPYPFYIPYHIPFVPYQVEPNANEDQERVNSEDESSVTEDSDATLNCLMLYFHHQTYQI